MRVPDDIMVVSFYNSNILEEHSSSITSIDFDICEWAKEAGTMLVKQLLGEEIGRKKVLSCKMVLKESTKFTL